MKLTLVLLALLTLGCESKQKQSRFKDNEGTFVLYQKGKGILKTINPELAQTRFSPCSTFKVPHAVFGLESTYITGKDFTLKYNSILNPAKDFWPTNWPQDHNLDSALKNSVVWYFQKVARNIGHEKMKKYIQQSNFGNKNISGGIDKFWLSSSLKISAIEQVQIWSNLFDYKLNFKKNNINLVKQLITYEKTPHYTLSAKTGACKQSNNKLSAWWLGSVEQDSKVYYFATLIFGDDYKKLFKKRKKLTKLLLQDEGLL